MLSLRRLNGSLSLTLSWTFSRVMAGVCLSTKNRLAKEKSPYLLQHADNPVDWYPWGQEAFEKAKAEVKPVFLSVGYSTCHWCHVMERESFQNEDIAKILNERFVSVKVDREERPDVDKVYMTFIQATQGGGGWPMSVFLTPDLKPIMGGTYFPPNDSLGRPGFATVLKTVSEHWKSKQDSLEQQGSKIMDLLSKSLETSGDHGLPGRGCIQRGYEMLEKRFDKTHGGFGNAPKFPQPTILNFLLTFYSGYSNSVMGERALEITLFTLKAMANGGIHDHVGQGFHRYSTDKFWHVPHFEKMLYDQGQLAGIYATAYQISKDEFFKDVLDDILLYVMRDLTDKEGGFYSAEDADSYPEASSTHKKEGAFCVWTKSEILSLLTAPISSEGKHQTMGDLFSYHYGVEEDGNVNPYQDPHNELTGKNVLIVRGSVEETARHFGIEELKATDLLKEGREILHQSRVERPKPHRDDKIVTSWNGLMISGFAQAYYVTKNTTYLEAAQKAAKFVKSYLYDVHKEVLIRNAYRDRNGDLGRSSIEGFADDYAFMIEGLLDLFEASQGQEWLEWACQLQEKMVELFWDKTKGGFFSTTSSDPSILLRMKDDQDGAEPSANSCSVHNLQRLSGYFGGIERGPKSTDIYKVFSEMIGEHPVALPKMVSGYLLNSQTTKQIIIAGESGLSGTEALLDITRSFYLPNKILVVHKPGTKTMLSESLEVLSSITEVDGKATAYVCENYKCNAPTTDANKLKKTLNPKCQF